MDHFREIAAAFACPGTYLGEVPYGSGHINDTFRVCYDAGDRETHYIHQRVNHDIFRDVSKLMENIGRVTRHQRKKLEASGAGDLNRRVLTLIPTVDGRDFYRDSTGKYWRTYACIENAVGFDVIESTDQVCAAARAFGEVQCQPADLPERLHETIPGFHNTRARFDALLQAAELDEFNRAAGVKAEIDFVLAREEMVGTVLDLMAAGEIPERVTHNDSKLNNVLIDTATDEGICVIDLDTVMHGSILYDFGDMIRSATNPSAEDERDLAQVEMNIDCFEALVKGCLETAAGFLVAKERELLAFSGRLITFETGLRFLTDYLQGDTCFKTYRAGQNLDRCRKQFKMVESIERQIEAMTKHPSEQLYFILTRLRYSRSMRVQQTRRYTMATNPIGKGTKTIGINMNTKMANELEKRAASMHISKSNYCKIILKQWIDSGKKLTLSE